MIVSCQLGATLVRGGEYPSRNFATTANSAAASLVGAILPTHDKITVIGGVKVATAPAVPVLGRLRRPMRGRDRLAVLR